MIKEPKMTPPPVGIIGGVGPFAGLDFVQKVFTNTIATKDQDHLNCMLVSYPSIIPDRTAFLLDDKGTVENPANGVFECAKRLHMAGVNIAAVACNTFHSRRIFEPFSDMVKTSLPNMQIVNMLETCATHTRESLRINKIGLLATKGTHASGVYHEYFREEEFTLLEPDAAGQENVHEAIYDESFGIKANSKNISLEAKNRIGRAIENLVEMGAQAVILGCTELPLATQNQRYSVPLIDPGLIVARKLIEIVAPEKLVADE